MELLPGAFRGCEALKSVERHDLVTLNEELRAPGVSFGGVFFSLFFHGCRFVLFVCLFVCFCLWYFFGFEILYHFVLFLFFSPKRW